MQTYNDIYNSHILPHLNYLTQKVYEKKSNLYLSDVLAFNDKAQFLEGKIINGLSFCLVNNKEHDYFDSIALDLLNFLSEAEYETWGILNALLGFLRLKQHNLLDTYLTPNLRSIFSEKLHYRTFLNENDLTLINKPTNYYGVAFGIASIRILLGFDKENLVDHIFNKLMTHIEIHSNGSDYMDETNGDGRFDRYTLLIPAELLNLCKLSNKPAPQKLLDMLRKSCEIYLSLANDNGDGFSYGRSIGAYGDTSALEILSMGCYLDILSKKEKQLAYAYALKIVHKFESKWYDASEHSINMWFKGRKTDDYRNKNRILGENYSLYLQIVHSFELFHLSTIDFKVAETKSITSLKQEIPFCHEYVFNQGEYQQKLYLSHILDRTCLIPFINGANKYYYSTPYLPTPHLQGVFETSANSYRPNLIPKLILEDGTELMPISYFSNIECIQEDQTLFIEATLPHLCKVGSENPIPYSEGSSKIKYTLAPTGITATFEFNTSNLKEVKMEFASFDHLTLCKSSVKSDSKYIKSINFVNFDTFSISAIDIQNEDYQTPNGPLRHLVSCSTNQPMTTYVGYHISFKN